MASLRVDVDALLSNLEETQNHLLVVQNELCFSGDENEHLLRQISDLTQELEKSNPRCKALDEEIQMAHVQHSLTLDAERDLLAESIDTIRKSHAKEIESLQAIEKNLNSKLKNKQAMCVEMAASIDELKSNEQALRNKFTTQEKIF